jgi:hypothetical protein
MFASRYIKGPAIAAALTTDRPVKKTAEEFRVATVAR